MSPASDPLLIIGSLYTHVYSLLEYSLTGIKSKFVDPYIWIMPGRGDRSEYVLKWIFSNVLVWSIITCTVTINDIKSRCIQDNPKMQQMSDIFLFIADQKRFSSLIHYQRIKSSMTDWKVFKCSVNHYALQYILHLILIVCQLSCIKCIMLTS
jgi:hypothetical protein